MLEDGDLVVFKLYSAYGELCVMGCPLGFVVHVLCLVFALLRLECSLPLLHLHVAAACCTSAGSCAPDPSYYSFFWQICHCTCHAETSSLLPNCLNKVLPHVSTVLSAFYFTQCAKIFCPIVWRDTHCNTTRFSHLALLWTAKLDGVDKKADMRSQKACPPCTAIWPVLQRTYSATSYTNFCM